MDAEFFNLLFKTSVIAILSFGATFLASIFICIDFVEGEKFTKVNWLLISLVSFVVMILALLFIGISVTNK